MSSIRRLRDFRIFVARVATVGPKWLEAGGRYFHKVPLSLDIATVAAAGSVELVVDAGHHRRVVVDGILKSRVSVDIATADFKAMLVPQAGSAVAGARR